MSNVAHTTHTQTRLTNFYLSMVVLHAHFQATVNYLNLWQNILEKMSRSSTAKKKKRILTTSFKEKVFAWISTRQCNSDRFKFYSTLQVLYLSFQVKDFANGFVQELGPRVSFLQFKKNIKAKWTTSLANDFENQVVKIKLCRIDCL